MYVEIRNGSGDLLAAGHGRDYKATLRRLYRHARPNGARTVVVDQWFENAEWRPFGTHHVQFGHPVRTGGYTLDPLIVVHVIR